jgi:hypothetical protein
MSVQPIWITGTSAGQFEERLQGLTTIVLARSAAGGSQASAFFYHRLGAKDPAKSGPQWRAITGTWLVTNRHVILPKLNGTEIPASSFSFGFRRVMDGQLKWEDIALSGQELFDRAKLHENREVDVVVLDVKDLLDERLKNSDNYLGWAGGTREHLPDASPFDVEVADDVLIVGYPRGFYDQSNLYPIVKSGVVASAWSRDFNGQPRFLIDARLFPGSSGSLVITSPSDIRVDDGKIFASATKEFAVLGIFSAAHFSPREPIKLPDMTITPRENLELGVVWHARLIEGILNSGI